MVVTNTKSQLVAITGIIKGIINCYRNDCSFFMASSAVESSFSSYLKILFYSCPITKSSLKVGVPVPQPLSHFLTLGYP